MGVLITDEPEETLFDVRLATAKRDLAEAVHSLRRTYPLVEDEDIRKGLAASILSLEQSLGKVAELITIRGQK